MESSWLTHLKKLHSLASSGLEFSNIDYDLDRYKEIQMIVSEMLADLAGKPVSAINNLLLPHIEGYETPKVDVRAAVIRNNKILLVQEKTDQRWALPGGYADVGYSAAENAEKEVWEEACIKVEASRLYAVRHKAKGEYKADIRDFYKFFFLCESDDNAEISPGSEVLAAEFFSLDALPELSLGRTVESDLIAAFHYKKHTQKMPYFDKGNFV